MFRVGSVPGGRFCCVNISSAPVPVNVPKLVVLPSCPNESSDCVRVCNPEGGDNECFDSAVVVVAVPAGPRSRGNQTVC